MEGEPVTFRSTSTRGDEPIIGQAWDLDNDGHYDDGTAPTATRVFSDDRSYTVSLGVVDADGEIDLEWRSISIAANRPPTASFNASTTSPLTGQSVTLTSTSSDPDGRPVIQAWDLDGDGAYDDATGASASLSFPDDGTRQVALRVTDSGGAQRTSSKTITVLNRAPVAGFGVSATTVDTGVPITFTSSATDQDGTVVAHRWDFNGDGATDATGQTVSHSFADNGTPTVELTVTDDDGATHSAERQLTIRNRPPGAAFGYSPAAPVAGAPVEFRSAATDPDGSVAEHRWDLDGDGAYDDGSGTQASTTFPRAGTYTVGLQVTDDDGAPAPANVQTIAVASAPPPPKPPAANPRPPISFPPQVVDGPKLSGPGVIAPLLMDPFPRVRIRGVTTRRGARVDLLSVRTVGGTRILVRCRGRSCPWRRATGTARFDATRFGLIRIQGFKRRHLRAGTVIQVFVTQHGRIGKYTSFKIRRLKAPRRVDRCTALGVSQVRGCPR